jgi:MarR family transcriptional regulator for hemolysin
MSIESSKIEEVVLFQIERTNKLARQYSQREFDQLELGITVEQWILMKILDEKAPLAQKELAEFSLRDPASITRTLDLLQKKGYVQREPIEGNRRQYAIHLTKEGSAFVKKHFHIVQAQRAQSVKGLSLSEVQHLKHILEKIQDNLK